MAQESEVVSLPFSKVKQLAVLGHTLRTPGFFTFAKQTLGPACFVDVHVGKLWAVTKAFHAKQGRVPTLAEIKDELGKDPEVQERCESQLEAAVQATQDYPADALEGGLKEWSAVKSLQTTLQGKATKLFNQGKFSEAAALLGNAAREYQETLQPEDNPVVYLTDKLLDAPPAPKSWIWDNRIPDRPGNVGTLAAPGGAGKTSMLVGLALHRACGKPYLGIRTKVGRTVLLSTEEAAEEYVEKISSWLEFDPSLSREAIKQNVILMPMVGHPPRLVKSEGINYEVNHEEVDALASKIAQYAAGADFIIMETVSRLAPDESNEGVSCFASALEKLGQKLKATILVVAHVGKESARSGNGDAYASRGGSALVDNCRFNLTLSTIPERASDQERRFGVIFPEEMRNSLMVFASPKVNAAAPQEPVILEKVRATYSMVLRPFDYEAQESFILERLEADRQKEIEGYIPLLVKFIQDENQPTRAKFVRSGSTYGVPRKLCEKVVDRAIELGVVGPGEKIPKGGFALAVMKKEIINEKE